MVDYLYRVISSPCNKEDWRLYISHDYPGGAQGYKESLWKYEDLINDLNKNDPNFKYKLQRYPLTQEWEDYG